ncbi:MAG: hypothetical protein ACK5MA_03250 [Parachlamydiaceae bacterium]
MKKAVCLFLFLTSCSYFTHPTPEIFEEIEVAIPQTPLPISTPPLPPIESSAIPEEEPQRELQSGIQVVPRTVIAWWSSKVSKTFENTNVFGAMELPLNYLGFKVEYVDIEQGFPDLSKRDDVTGIIAWFQSGFVMDQIDTYLRWSVQQIEAHIKYILVGSIAELSIQGEALLIDELWNKLGVSSPNDWVAFTYDYEISDYDHNLYPFERKIPLTLPQFLSFELLPGRGESLLTLRSKSHPDLEFTAAVVNENGAFIQEAFLIYYDPAKVFANAKWHLNPFKLLKMVFKDSLLPIPDPTTLSGRRIYYSQVDGDGWNNVTLTKRQQSVPLLYSSQIILDQIVRENPDYPVTIGPIAAEIDPKWFGTPESRNIAEEFFHLPNVEVGSHTFTHPFDWSFFENYTVQKELPYLKNYPNATFEKSPFEFLKNLKYKPSSYYSLSSDEERYTGLQKGYVIPRAYALEPFSETQEVFGAIEEINQLAPENKKVEVYQWSGNGEAFESILELTVDAGVENINGAYNRYDFTNASYTSLYPLGTSINGFHQIFNSNCNENDYTNLWTKNYYGYATVRTTYSWTETPVRVKPIDLYYHMYSGERQASLSAIKLNIDYIRSKKVCPIATSHYSKIVRGFYNTEILQVENNAWQIANRGALQTMRFDQAVFKGVDFNRSRGIIGQKHLHGSLYISLDEAEENPLIVIKEIEESTKEPSEAEFYLIDSRWIIRNIHRDSLSTVAFEMQGFGIGEMEWNTPEEGDYEIHVTDSLRQTLYRDRITASEQTLQFNLPVDALDPLNCTITKLHEAE